VETFATIEASDPAHCRRRRVRRRSEIAAKLDGLVAAPPAEPIVCRRSFQAAPRQSSFMKSLGIRGGPSAEDISEGQTFTKMLGSKVLPEFVSVEFNPTLTNYRART